MTATSTELLHESLPQPSTTPENRLVAGHPMEAQCAIGVVGLSVTSRNLLLNLEDKGIQVAAYDQDEARVAALRKEAQGRRISAHSELETFMKSLRKPRAVLLLLPAGAAGDSVRLALRTQLETGDVIVDGSNSV
jgi:6-phosphogluconate dehydrogenase